MEDPSTNARLTVRFDNFFTKPFRVKGEYVIVKLSENYDLALIGSTNRKSLLILSRTPEADQDLLQEYIQKAKELGFKTERLIYSEF